MVPIKLGSLIDCAFISTNWLFIFVFAITLGHCSDRLQSFWMKTLLSQIDIRFHFLRLLKSTQIRIFFSFSWNIQIFNHFLEWLTTLNRFWVFFQTIVFRCVWICFKNQFWLFFLSKLAKHVFCTIVLVENKNGKNIPTKHVYLATK